MRGTLIALVTAGFGVSTLSALAAPQPIAKIEKVAIRLVYTTTGAFSPDIADPAGFTGWNTVIGAGDAKEPADDLLIQVHLRMNRPEGNLVQPLIVEVTGEDRKRLGRHECKSIFFKDGRSVCSFIVRSATCAGRLSVKAAIGRERRNGEAILRCGE